MKNLSILLMVLLNGCVATRHSFSTNNPVPNNSVVIDASVSTVLQQHRDVEQQHVINNPCPDGMVHVEGNYCPQVEEHCAEWSRDDPTGQRLRCLRFSSNNTCVSRSRIHMSFCMDRYEYPNMEGANPITMMSWEQARNTCMVSHKRLCTNREWTLACEGENLLPYPYGLVRDRNICRIDHQTILYNARRLANPRTRMEEARRVYEAVPSGSMTQCVSPFGIHDMTGNVDEWVLDVEHHRYPSGLKGGWWAPVRTRCRPMTTSHGPTFSYYNISFRCCSDVNNSTD